MRSFTDEVECNAISSAPTPYLMSLSSTITLHHLRSTAGPRGFTIADFGISIDDDPVVAKLVTLGLLAIRAPPAYQNVLLSCDVRLASVFQQLAFAIRTRSQRAVGLHGSLLDQ
jgi:hypothetical protein